jgi:tellurite resistance-related uncharacterized protein
MKALPQDAVPYRRTAEFTESTVPAALRSRHSTKSDVWAGIRVLEGSLLYRILEPVVEEHVLTPETSGIVEPGVPHEVHPLGPVRFFVEFLRRETTDFSTLALADAPSVVAPDDAAVRVLLALRGGSMARFELPAGGVSRAVAHRTVRRSGSCSPAAARCGGSRTHAKRSPRWSRVFVSRSRLELTSSSAQWRS